MKICLVFICFSLVALTGFTQTPPTRDTVIPPIKDTIVPAKGNPVQQLKDIKTDKKEQFKDSADGQPKKSPLIDTTIQNKYGDLLRDDTAYNKKYKLWKPAVQVIGINAFLVGFDRYVLKADFSRVGFQTWSDNLKNGWEWDPDRFGVNFIGHPYSGSLYFNAARANGYNFWQSFPFAVSGSLLWEYFGETTRPSYNDIINTPVSGTFFGEILYRLSSNILDDRTRGTERVVREVLAGLVSPMRGFNRLLQKKTGRLTNKEVYQKEPLNITVIGGIHKINEDANAFFGKGPTNPMISVQLDYGNPFEDRKRKPFDLFRLRTEFSFGVGRKILDNITGYGILFGRNHQIGKLSMLIGGFQYYDYWDNKSFELGAIAFGGGAFFKLPVSKNSFVYTNIHLGVIPLAGNSTRFGPDTSQFRDYNYGGGLETKLETTITLGRDVTASLLYHYYLIHTYEGAAGNNFIGILEPKITIRVLKNFSVGYEYYGYADNRQLSGFDPIHSTRTESKIFLSLFLEDPQRKGRYN
ncbi:MAG: hypothetical protein JWQ30_85 [Sediminibacterium sp.]|nr:hypothetical protein [Sediminibacterium sp.]